MTIYEIKRLTKDTAPYFFSKDTMRFFGQTLESFRVKKQLDGRYKISAKSGNQWDETHWTIRYFNPENNKLESK